jgi:hypothetical protein
MEKEKLNEIVNNLNEKHKDDFENIDEPVLVVVKLSNGDDVYFEIGKNGIVEHPEKPDIKNQVIISFKDLEKIEKNKKLLLNYLMRGKIKLKGNIKKLMNVIQEIF